MRLETKQNEKARSSPQISGVMVLHNNMVSPQMVSPQNGVTGALSLHNLYYYITIDQQ